MSSCICSVCGIEIQSPKLSTIGNQIVCSLACVGLLTSNKHDACDYCKRPVWKDNYYILNNKYYCREKCKNEIKRRSKISEKNIQHIKQNVFPTDNLPLKNSQQLREDVLKIFKDFKFDSAGDYTNDNRNKTPNYNNNITSLRTKDNTIYFNTKNIINNNNKKSFVQNKQINEFMEDKSKYRNPSNDGIFKAKNSTDKNLKSYDTNNSNNFRNKVDYSRTMKNHNLDETKESYRFYKPNKTIIYNSKNVSHNEGSGLSLRGLKNNNSNKYNNHQVYNVYYKNSLKTNGK